LIFNAIDPKSKKLRTPTESGLGYRNSAGASGKKVAELVKYERADKTQDEID
jgi:hypothetical protein